MFDVSGQIAVITGAGQGLGLTFARALADAGCTVVLTGRDAERLEKAAADIDGARTAPFDVTDAAGVSAAIARIERTIGPISILVNNAGTTVRRPLTDMAEQDWRTIIDTNLTGAFLVATETARHMMPRRRGKIINICSIRAKGPRAGSAAYAASKGGLKLLTQGMCADWAPHGIQVNALAPGYIASGMADPRLDLQAIAARTPAARLGTPDDLTGTLIYLASPASDFVNGQIIYVDGGYSSIC
jgi:gluconate 5-dehydrogenase